MRFPAVRGPIASHFPYSYVPTPRAGWKQGRRLALMSHLCKAALPDHSDRGRPARRSSFGQRAAILDRPSSGITSRRQDRSLPR